MSAPITIPYTSPTISKLRKQAYNRWVRLYGEKLAVMAIRLADRWALREAVFFSGTNEYVMGKIIEACYPEALRMAEKWLQKVSQ